MSEQGTPTGSPPDTGLLDRQIDKAFERRMGGDGPGGGGMEARIAKLEVSVQHMQGDLTEIRTTLAGLSHHLHQLPSKQNMFNNTIAMVGIGLTVIVLGVGGIIAGLGWLQARDVPPAPQAPSPMVFQLPPQAQAVAPIAPTVPKSVTKVK